MDYPSETLRRFEDPERAGELPPGPGRPVVATAGSVEEGALVRFALRVQAGRISTARFLAYGCPYVIAACSLAAEQLEGRSVEDLGRIEAAALSGGIGAPPERLGRLLRIEDALRSCRQAWENTELYDPLQGGG